MTCMAEEWAAQRSSAGGGHPMNVLDSAEDVKCTTNEEAFPWIVIDLRRPYRITKVAFLSGDKPIENLDVRVGNAHIGQHNDGSSRFVKNKRCAMFHGPTLVTKQWVDLDCGYTKGITGSKVIDFCVLKDSIFSNS